MGRRRVTPVGWFYGFMAIAYSHLGDVTDRDMMFGGVVLFAIAPTIAFILAVYAARAGHRSGKIAVIVSGLLLLATLVVLALAYWWVGLPVTGVVAVLVPARVLSRRIAVVVSGLRRSQVTRPRHVLISSPKISALATWNDTSQTAATEP